MFSQINLISNNYYILKFFIDSQKSDGEKRSGESTSGRPEKKRKQEEYVDDVSENTIAEILATIEDGKGNAGPQVKSKIYIKDDE